MTWRVIRRIRTKLGSEHVSEVASGFASEDEAWAFVRRNRLAAVEVVRAA